MHGACLTWFYDLSHTCFPVFLFDECGGDGFEVEEEVLVEEEEVYQEVR